MSESNSQQPEERKRHDIKIAEQTVSNILGMQVIKIKTAIRLGKKSQDGNGYIQKPVKVVLDGESCRDKIIDRCSEMRKAKDLANYQFVH